MKRLGIFLKTERCALHQGHFFLRSLMQILLNSSNKVLKYHISLKLQMFLIFVVIIPTTQKTETNFLGGILII